MMETWFELAEYVTEPQAILFAVDKPPMERQSAPGPGAEGEIIIPPVGGSSETQTR